MFDTVLRHQCTENLLPSIISRQSRNQLRLLQHIHPTMHPHSISIIANKITHVIIYQFSWTGSKILPFLQSSAVCKRSICCNVLPLSPSSMVAGTLICPTLLTTTHVSACSSASPTPGVIYPLSSIFFRLDCWRYCCYYLPVSTACKLVIIRLRLERKANLPQHPHAL